MGHKTSVFKGFLGGSDGKEYACNAGDLGSIPGLGGSPGGGHAACISVLAWRIPMDRGACGLQYSEGFRPCKICSLTTVHFEISKNKKL